MKRHVFTLAPFPAGTTWSIRVPALVHQMVKVLKLRIGEEVQFVDGAGKRANGEIVGYSERNVEVKIRDVPDGNGEEAKHITAAKDRLFVCVSILKKDHFEWLTEKLAEIGITDLVPLVSARTIKKDVRLDRLETIAREAMEQSEQSVAMTVHAPTDLMGAVRLLSRSGIKAVVADTGRGLRPIRDVLVSSKAKAVFVGPEGGWSDEERAFFEKECAFLRVSLGESVLRGETAGILAGFCLVQSA